VLYFVYVVQVGLGAVIHFVKRKGNVPIGRPPQNYLHVALGLIIIGTALLQVRTGYNHEWPNAVGQAVPNYINILWYAWVGACIIL
jgi:hypothetical protein